MSSDSVYFVPGMLTFTDAEFERFKFLVECIDRNEPAVRREVWGRRSTAFVVLAACMYILADWWESGSLIALCGALFEFAVFAIYLRRCENTWQAFCDEAHHARSTLALMTAAREARHSA